jgi:hypothetical protein
MVKSLDLRGKKPLFLCLYFCNLPIVKLLISMGYIIIEIPIVKGEIFSYADFDKKKFEQENNVTLNGDPIKVEKSETRIIVTYEGKNEIRPPRSFSVG